MKTRILLLAALTIGATLASAQAGSTTVSYSGTIPAGPFQLRYRIEGEGTPALVIGSAICYPRVFSDNLRRHLRLVFLDHRGFAASPGKVDNAEFALDVLLDDMERARQELNLGRIAAIGHSGNSYMALEYAKKYPANVSHVIMIGIAPDLSPASAAAAGRYWEEMASPERKAALAENLRQVTDEDLAKLAPSERMFGGYIRNGPKIWFDPHFDSTPLWSGVVLNQDMYEHVWGKLFRDLDITQGLAGFDRPVFLALGRHDFLVAPPSSWDPVRDKFRDLTIRIFERSGHAPQYDEPERFDAELLQWMREKSTSRADVAASDIAAIEPSPVQFELRSPAGTGRFPVVALVPGCSGFRDARFASRYQWYAQQLLEHGFGVMFVDYLESRRVREACSDRNAGIWEPRISADLQRAATVLAADARVDASRLSVVGWSMGGGGVLEYLSRLPPGGGAAFGRAVVYYPTCRSVQHLNGRVPTLLFLAALDNIQPASFCETLVSSVGDTGRIAVRRFEGSHHGFDFVDLPVNMDATDELTVASNPASANAAWTELLAFLDEDRSIAPDGTDAKIPSDASPSDAESLQRMKDKTADTFAPILEGRLHYETAGSGEPLVLIHGNAGDQRHWDGQWAAFARHFRVIRYDVRGFGKSSLPVPGVRYTDYDDLAALYRHLGIESAHVAGWPMGSGIAVDLALAFPERVKSLVLVGPWVNGHTSTAVDAWMEAPFFRDTICEPSAGEQIRRIANDHTFWAFADKKNPRAVLEPTAIGRVAEIRAPMLIVVGDREIPACLEVADLLARSLPQSRKVVMSGTGHLLHMEKLGDFNRIVLEFLQSVATRRLSAAG